MAVSPDSYGGSATAASGVITQSVTVTNPNSTLVVYVKAYDPTTASNTDITSVTYNGVNLTQLQHYAVGDTGHAAQFANVSLYSYAITGLSAGTHNLVATWPSGVNSPQLAYTVYGNAAGAIDNSNVNEYGSVSSYTGSITTVAANAWVWSSISFDNQGSVVTDSSLQEVYNTGYDDTASDKSGHASPGSVTHTYTNGTPDYYVILMVSIAPAVTPSFTGPKPFIVRQAVKRAAYF